jgi:hypothetical protein
VHRSTHAEGYHFAHLRATRVLDLPSVRHTAVQRPYQHPDICANRVAADSINRVPGTEPAMASHISRPVLLNIVLPTATGVVLPRPRLHSHSHLAHQLDGLHARFSRKHLPSVPMLRDLALLPFSSLPSTSPDTAPRHRTRLAPRTYRAWWGLGRQISADGPCHHHHVADPTLPAPASENKDYWKTGLVACPWMARVARE